MKRILVGVDASNEARHAASFTMDLAAATGAKVIFAAVSAAGDPFASPELQARYKVFEEEEKAQLAKMVQGLAVELHRPGVIIETIVETGAPATKLAELAGRLEVDLVVVGHRGRGAMKRMLLGSVADRLVQICPKPVTVVR
jgi:nucleotide-binding universal stress UspA family protein